MRTILCFFFIASYVESIDTANEEPEADFVTVPKTLITGLQEDVTRLQERVDQLEKLEARFQALETKLDVSANIRYKRQEELAAFSVKLSRPLTHMTVKQPIKFDEVLLNKGNRYSAATGHFTASIPGTYLFIYFMGHHSTGETWIELVKNGVRVNLAVAEGSFASQNLQGGNAAIIPLAVGDNVWVEITQVSNVPLQEQFTTFSGAILY
ncbi:C1q-related factor-like [Mya arenaria]|uniref:C1q-related factor-like n=1 Tax=Mya arenaria TaxID=6604 RepID=UPI0022E73F0B|nr:C1q-related factor-like [Mya arenaria]